MTHIDENTLELLVLGDPKVRRREKQLRQHLAECAGCMGLFEEIRSYYAEVELHKSPSGFPVSSVGQRALIRKRNELEPYFELPETRAVPYAEVRMPSRWKRIDQFRRTHPVSSTFAVFAVAVVLALSAGYFRNALAPNPSYVHLNIQKGTMQVFSKNNRLLWSIPGSGLQEAKHQMRQYGTAYWQVTDLNSDGGRDVATILPGLGTGGNAGARLQIFGPSGKLQRRVDIDPGSVSFRGHVYSQPFGPINMMVADVGKNGEKEMFVGVTDGHSPYCVYRLDAHGDILGEYWHFGNLAGMASVELSDGKRYLALCGENDIEDREKTSYPVLIILDPTKIVGKTQSEVTPGFGFKQSDAEVYYVRLSNTDMNYALHAYMAVRRLNGESDKQMSFNLDSGPSALPDGMSPSFDVTFSKRMTVLAYNASNASITIHGELRNQGLVKGTIDKAYLSKLKDEARYWNGSDWVEKPTRIDHRADRLN